MPSPFKHPEASLFIPDNCGSPKCFSRTTHLGIGAHQDDLEIMAFHGIAGCYAQNDLWFGGITCTNGLGSPRTGLFTQLSAEQFKTVREMEQNEAATIGAYSIMAQLGYSSEEAQGLSDHLEEDLVNLLAWTQPTVVYAHNPGDKHPTHIGVLKVLLRAIRRLPPEMRPMQLLGCEVWRDLDWVSDRQKILLNVTGYDVLASKILAVFASQITGGKRYDLAALGRRRSNATFLNAHIADQIEQAIFAVDLSALLTNDDLTLPEVMEPLLKEFRKEVMDLLMD